jgi:hypothetical protein
VKPERSRPAGNRAAQESLARNTTEPTGHDRHELAAQLARRRECADRLPPLADGRRDPWRERPRRYLSLDSARATWCHFRDCRLLSLDTAAVLLAECDPAELGDAGIPQPRRGGER